MFLAAAIVLQLQAPAPFMRTPSIHGNLLTFISEGDVWVGDLKTGEAKRLTSDPGVEQKPVFSPDGSAIAFSGEYDGERQIYTVPTDGGEPRKVTEISNCRIPTAWSADGKSVVFRANGAPTAYEFYTVPATGGMTTKMPLEFASYVSMGPTGGEFTFTRFFRSSAAWFKYIGGMQNQIWTYRNGKFQAVTDLPGTNEYPVWVKDRIYFAHEEHGNFSLMSVAETGGKARVELAPDTFEIRELTTDGEKVVFEHGQEVQLLDTTDKSMQTVHMHLVTDLIHMRKTRVPATKNLDGASLSPTGKRVLASSRGQIISLPVEEGEARVWKAKAGVRYRNPIMSADAKMVAYFGDETGERQLYVANADGSGERQLTHDTKGTLVQATWSPDGKMILLYDSRMEFRLVNVLTGTDTLVGKTSQNWAQPPISFSPDSKWLAFITVRPATFYGEIKLYEIATGKTTSVSDPMVDDTAVRFSQDGNYLVVLSRRNFAVSSDTFLNQLNTGGMIVPGIISIKKDGPDPMALKDPSEPIKEDAKPVTAPPKPPAPGTPVTPPPAPNLPTAIDFDAFMERRDELPVPPSNYNDIWMLGNKIYLHDGPTIKVFDLESKSMKDLSQAAAYDFSADGSKLLTLSGSGINVVDLAGGAPKPVVFGNLTLAVDPEKEYHQIFWEAWRYLRDYFYVENMHGLDWKAIGDKYSALLPRVRSRNELDELIRWMQAEIGSSHEYIDAGDNQDLKARVVMPSLGADLSLDPSGFYKITHIVKGDGVSAGERSPLLGAGKNVSEGMYLVEVGGVPTSADADPLAPLIGRTGQIISIKVNTKPSLDGAKTVLVKPVANDTAMRYREWVQRNRDYVTKISGGRIGYVHMAAMQAPDFEQFIKQYMAQRDKEAMIIDDRYNNGGFVQEMINRVLATRLSGYFNERDSDLPWTRQTDYFNGPMACLINEFDISCGEEFPYRFRQLKLGPLIGRRTMGGEVGSDPGWPLIDGGKVFVPNYGFYEPGKGWQIEGRGVEPDIDVPSDPNQYMAGHDPQLDKAVEVLLGQLKNPPVWKSPQPPSKDRVKDGDH